jgi:soluble lytic murein transglycosylase-like protein
MNTSAVRLKHWAGQYQRVISVVHHSLALWGAIVLLGLAAYAGHYWASTAGTVESGPAAFGQIRYAGNLLFDSSIEAEVRQYRALANFLAKRYRVASDATERVVSAAFDASRQVGIDPLLLLAVVGIESRFNPIAESEFGAKGLMQIIPRMHTDKLDDHGGARAILEPANNILLGARILKQYIRQTGSVEAGLQVYNGAYADGTNQYAAKVIAEQDRMRQAMRASRPLARADTSDIN